MNGPQVALARRRQAAASQSRADRPDHRGVRRARPRCGAAYAQAIGAVPDDPEELVDELPELRQPAGAAPRRFAGPDGAAHGSGGLPARRETSSRRWRRSPARSPTRCWRRCSPGRTLDKAYVNNGGDIALHLAAGPGDARWPSPAPATALPTASSIRADDPVRGIATSGWRGRSFSLGIADAVTVLARTRRRGRCRGDADRQRRRPARPSARSRGSRPASWRPTAISASGW